MRIAKNCEFCDVLFEANKKARKFCSISCSTKRQYRDNPDYGLQKGHKLRNGIAPWNKGKANPELSRRQKENNVSKRVEVRKKISEAKTKFYNEGGRPWNWNGGHSKNRKYQTVPWLSLIKQIYERDNWTCRGCGKRGGRLNAHYKLPWSNFPELAFDPSNIVTLCVSCHSRIHYLDNLAPFREVQEVSQ